MPPDLTLLDEDLRRRFAELGTAGVEQRVEWLQAYPVGVRIEALLAIQDRDWAALATAAGEWRREAEAQLAQMAAQQDTWRALSDDVERLRGIAHDGWRPPGERPDWPEVRALLVADLPSAGFTPAQIEERIDGFAAATWRDMMSVLDRPMRRWARQLQRTARSRLCALAAADCADAVVAFNRAVEGPAPAADADLDAIEARLHATLAAIHASLRVDPRADVATAARAAGEAAVEVLPGLLASAARRTAGGGVDDRRLAVRVADLIRVALLVRSAGRLVLWNAGWPDRFPLLAAWRRRARATSVDTAFRPPAVTAIAEVVADPAAFDGDYLTLEGTVGPVEIVHRRGKPISSTTLVDADGVVVRVGLPHLKLDSGGLVQGTYAIVTGTYAEHHRDFATPVLIPDRRDLAADGRRGWLDWLQLELRPIVTPTPHELCVRWSWAAGVDGAGNLLRYGTWAGPARGSVI